MIQCVLSPTLSLHFAHPSFMPLSPCFSSSFSTQACARTRTHTQSTQPWKTQSAVWPRSLANELSYWNRKESALCCRKCCYSKPHRRGTGRGNYLFGQRNMRMSFHYKCTNLHLDGADYIHFHHTLFLSTLLFCLITSISHFIVIPKKKKKYFSHWFSLPSPRLLHRFEHSVRLDSCSLMATALLYNSHRSHQRWLTNHRTLLRSQSTELNTL